MFHLTSLPVRWHLFILRPVLLVADSISCILDFPLNDCEIPLFPHFAHDFLGDKLSLGGINPKEELDGRVLESLQRDFLLHRHVVKFVGVLIVIIVLTELHKV
jgi:hypothetical protein